MTNVAACEFTTAGSTCVVTANSTRNESEKSADYDYFRYVEMQSRN